MEGFVNQVCCGSFLGRWEGRGRSRAFWDLVPFTPPSAVWAFCSYKLELKFLSPRATGQVKQHGLWKDTGDLGKYQQGNKHPLECTLNRSLVHNQEGNQNFCKSHLAICMVSRWCLSGKCTHRKNGVIYFCSQNVPVHVSHRNAHISNRRK